MLNFRYVILLSILFFCLQSHASHIVGGVINYKHTGGADYDIIMKIYRDCTSTTGFDGDGSSSSAGTANVFIYDATTLSLELTLNLINPVVTPVNPIITNPCMTIPNVCVEEGVYNASITVPDPTRGYIIYYERCCRNNTISNIVNPGGTGAIYTAFIPPAATIPNSNPEFNTFPPLFICQNAPLVFNHSATDDDGDSLYYHLCPPFMENLTSPSSPTVGFGPAVLPAPFPNINWNTGYTFNAPLGGNPSMNIHPSSGVLLTTPPLQGQFVVGICVDEYRNGQLISTTFRDFQFNVVPCNIPIANIPSFDIDPNTGIGFFTINCNNFQVDFVNNSAGATSYYWDFGDPNSTTDNSTLVNPTYTYTDTGTFLVTLIATNSMGCSDTTHAYVLIYPIFVPDFGFENVCADSAVSFMDLSTTTTGFVNSWTWSFGDGDTSTSQNPRHLYPGPGTYNVDVQVTTSTGCDETVSDVVTIHPLPQPNFTTGSRCIDSPVVFTNLTPGVIVENEWHFGDGSPFETTLNASHTYNTSSNFNVQLVVVNDRLCRDTVTQTIFINPLPNILANNDTLVCPFYDVQLSATGAVSYDWTPAGLLNHPDIFNPVATMDTTATVFYVHGTDVNGCINHDSVWVDLLPLPPADAGEDTSVCLNPSPILYRDSVPLVATGGIIYTWSPSTGLNDPNIPNPIAKPTQNTTYSVFVTDANGCHNVDSVNVFVLDPGLNLIGAPDTLICERDSLTIDVVHQGASIYQWSPSTGVSNDTIIDPLFYPADTTLYILTVQNYCYAKDDSIIVNVISAPLVDAGPIDSVCIGDSAQLNASGALTYAWDATSTLSDLGIPDPIASPVITETYYLTGTDQYGCTNRDSVILLVHQLPVIALSNTPDSVCRGTPIQLFSNGGVQYEWSPATGLSNAFIPNPMVFPTDTISYDLLVTNIHGCFDDTSITINVQQPITLDAGDPAQICIGDTVQLYARSDEALRFLWTPDHNISDVHSTDVIVHPTTTTTYVVTAQNDCPQFTVSEEVRVVVHPLPVIDLTNDTSILRGQQVLLEANDGVTYDWFPEDYLEQPDESSTIAEPFNSIAYTVTVTTENGCLKSDTVFIEVHPVTQLYVPDAFSPNGDGVNDLFGVLRHLNIAEFDHISVYNRWGQKMWQGETITSKWDGTFKGKQAPLETYAWYAAYTDYEGIQRISKGNVTLLR